MHTHICVCKYFSSCLVYVAIIYILLPGMRALLPACLSTYTGEECVLLYYHCIDPKLNSKML